MIAVSACTSRRVGRPLGLDQPTPVDLLAGLLGERRQHPTVRAPRRTAIDRPVATRSPSGSSSSSAKRRNTSRGPAGRGRAPAGAPAAGSTGGQAATVDVMAPIGCSPAISTSRTLSIHEASASSRSISPAVRAGGAASRRSPRTRRRRRRRPGTSQPDTRITSAAVDSRDRELHAQTRPERARDAAAGRHVGGRTAISDPEREKRRSDRRARRSPRHQLPMLGRTAVGRSRRGAAVAGAATESGACCTSVAARDRCPTPRSSPARRARRGRRPR